MPAVAAAIAAKESSPCDSTVAHVVTKLPKYVEVRYEAPILTIVEAQRIFSQSLFVVADFLRRTNHDQLYWKFVEEGRVPVRTFDQMG